MLTFFPKQIATKALAVYLLALVAVSVLFYRFSMPIVFMLIGVSSVFGFFFLSSQYTVSWSKVSSKTFVKRLFWYAFAIRVAWVVFSYFFYIHHTGQPFEFEAGDVMFYDDIGRYGHQLISQGIFPTYFLLDSYAGGLALSDTGYPYWLIFIYSLTNNSIIITRIIKSALSACMCVLVYRLTVRTINEQVGRIAGIFCLLMPNLIIYCGMHLKETEMLFLLVAFLERADWLLRSRRFTVWMFVVPILLGASLFLFRTVLGVVAFFSLFTALMVSSTRVVRKGKKVIVAIWVVLAVMVLAGGMIMTEVETLIQDRSTNQDLKREEQTSRGNLWAKYATGTVMAPMMFVMPFSTMVDTNQQNQLVLHGGNYVRNFMGFFVLMALFVSIFRNKDWRNLSLIGAYAVSYLAVLAMSGFANSERFLLPALPGLIIMWAYGIYYLNAKSYGYLFYWQIIVFMMEFAWAYFKLGSRGIL